MLDIIRPIPFRPPGPPVILLQAIDYTGTERTFDLGADTVRDDNVPARVIPEVISGRVAVLESRINRNPTVTAQIEFSPNMVPVQWRDHKQMPGRDALRPKKGDIH